MNLETARVGAFLAHYASEYYDPAKAREYYLRTRELKGKRSTSDLKSEDKKQAWSYANNQISEEKKSVLEQATERRKQFLEEARATAQAKREEIRAKLEQILEQLTEAGKQGQEALAQDRLDTFASLRKAAEAKIEALPPIPNGASEAQRARLMTKRREDIAKIRGDLNDDLQKADEEFATAADDFSERVKGRKSEEREGATLDREAVRTELKATVNKARDDYVALKQQIIDEYEAKAQKEFDGIRTNMPDDPASKKSSSDKAKKSEKTAKTKVPGTKSLTLQEAAVETLRRQKS